MVGWKLKEKFIHKQTNKKSIKKGKSKIIKRKTKKLF